MITSLNLTIATPRVGEASVPPDTNPRGIPPPDTPDAGSPEPFSFTGTGREYFRIWIVSTLLSLVTLGVYSAWAKVRRLQYFYRHTRVAGASFDYHGNPAAILRGRAIAVVLLGSYTLAGTISPFAVVAVVCVIALLFPFLAARSLRFRMHNSSYRGLRFGFAGSIRRAYWVFLGMPLLALLVVLLLSLLLWLGIFGAEGMTGGVLGSQLGNALVQGVLGPAVILALIAFAPFWYQRLKKYQHAHTAFGQTRFAFDAPVGGFYRIFLTAGAAFAVMLMMVSMVFFALSSAPGSAPVLTPSMLLTVGALYWLGLLSLRSYITARTQNFVWSHTQAGPHRFDCWFNAGELFQIKLTNLVGTVLTLGLFRPFGQIRVARYMAGAISLIPVGSLDEFVAAEQQAVSAVGAETLDFFDIDLAF